MFVAASLGVKINANSSKTVKATGLKFNLCKVND